MGNKGGRPKITWTEKDCNTFKVLCSQFNTEEDICAVMGVNTDTLVKLINEYLYEEITGKKRTRRSPKVGFSEAFKKFSANGRMSLRREQYRLATRGDRTMLIWLGKQHLGQSEKVEERQQVTSNQKIDVSGETDEELIAELKKAAKVVGLE